MMKSFKKCLKNKQIYEDPGVISLVEKEIKAASEDLKEAKDRFKNKRYKYVTITAYYASFHAAKALINSQGFQERNHHCLVHAIEELFVNKNKLPMKYIRNLLHSVGLREDADYASEYSVEGAKICLENDEEFIKIANKLLK